MAAVLAALRRVRRPAAAAQRRMSGVPDDIAALQRASVAALSATRAGEGSASAPGAAPGGPQEPGAPLMPPQEPGPEDCCVRAPCRRCCAPMRAPRVLSPVTLTRGPRCVRRRTAVAPTACGRSMWRTARPMLPPRLSAKALRKRSSPREEALPDARCGRCIAVRAGRCIAHACCRVRRIRSSLRARAATTRANRSLCARSARPCGSSDFQRGLQPRQ